MYSVVTSARLIRRVKDREISYDNWHKKVLSPATTEGDMQMVIKIRPMTESDVKSVSDLISAGYRFIAEPDGITDQQLKRLLEERCLPKHVRAIRNRFYCSVAEVEGRVVGLIALCGHNIEELWVLPEYHRQGIGTVLFQHAEQSIANSGHGKVAVLTTGYGKPFYQAMGMEVVDHRKVTIGPLVGRELVLLEKHLQKE